MHAKQIAIATALTCAVLVLVVVFYGQYYSTHHDLAGTLLSGVLASELGPRFEEYNAYFPPVEMVWYQSAYQLGQRTSVNAQTIIILMTFASTLFSAALAYVVRQRTIGAGIWFFALPMLVLLVMPILYKNIYGLREHLVVLGMWPYLVLRASTTDAKVLPTWLRIIVGVWLGVTLLFKYFYSIAIFLIEAGDAMSQRRFLHLFRIENVIAGLIVFVYLMLWLGIDADQRQAMLAVRGAISANIASLQGNLNIAVQYGGAGVVIWLLLYRFRLADRLSAIGLAAVIGAVLVSWLQQRWYTHHTFPIIMAFVVWWWMVGSGLPRWLHLICAIALVFPIQSEFTKSASYQHETDAAMSVLAAHDIDLADKRVGLLNQHPSPFSQVIATHGGTRWSPFPNIAYVSAALKPRDLPQQRGTFAQPLSLVEPGHQFLHGKLMDLWQDDPPDVLILDTTRQWPLRYLRFRWEDVFANDPAFTNVLQNYTLQLKHEGDRLTFAYYTRNVD